MRITTNAEAQLKKRLNDFIKRGVEFPGLIVHKGFMIEDPSRGKTKNVDLVLGICGWPREQAMKLKKTTIYGFDLYIPTSALSSINKHTIDYVEWTDLKTRICQPYFQLR